ncbi:MAG TPA: hypothetical protein VIM77_04060 [Mucilaginibacter sp.]
MWKYFAGSFPRGGKYCFIAPHGCGRNRVGTFYTRQVTEFCGNAQYLFGVSYG